MGLYSAIIRELTAAGLTGEALVAAVERLEAEQAAAAAETVRTPGARRTQRWRSKQASLVTSQASQGVTVTDAPAPSPTPSPSPSSSSPPLHPLVITTSPDPIPAHTPAPKTRVTALALAGWPADFRNQFWEAYPHKIGKADALGKLEKVGRTGAIGFDDLMAAVQRYRAKNDDRPWANPATWLHQQRWTDEPAAVNGKRTKPTLGEACDSLLDQIRKFDEPRRNPGIRDAAGEAPLRLLPPR